VNEAKQGAGRFRVWVTIGVVAVALAAVAWFVLDLPSRFFAGESIPAELSDTLRSGCQNGCLERESSTSFCRAYCDCIVERLESGRTERDLSRMLLAAAQDPDSPELESMQAQIEACNEQARAATD
jgi:hypothetical protein